MNECLNERMSERMNGWKHQNHRCFPRPFTEREDEEEKWMKLHSKMLARRAVRSCHVNFTSPLISDTARDHSVARAAHANTLTDVFRWNLIINWLGYISTNPRWIRWRWITLFIVFCAPSTDCVWTFPFSLLLLLRLAFPCSEKIEKRYQLCAVIIWFIIIIIFILFFAKLVDFENLEVV